MPKVNVVFIDIEGDRANLGYGINDLVNEAASQALIDAVTLGTVNKRTLISSTVEGTDALPASPYAAAGRKLRIHFTDDVTGESGFYSIPTADAGALTIVGNEVAIDSPQAMIDLVADINTNWLSRDNNAVTVQRAELVSVNR